MSGAGEPMRVVRAALIRSLPGPVRDELRRRHRGRQLDSAVRALLRLPSGAAPDDLVLERLREGWDNPGWTATLPLLRSVARVALATADGAVECGSGATTLLLAALLPPERRPLHVLEHDAAWAERVEAALCRVGLAAAVRLHHAPLVAYDEFDWYVPPAGLPERIGFVLCDGPPDALARGGRYGLPRVLGERFTPDVRIVLDDTHRPGEQAIVARWRDELGMVVESEHEAHVVLARG